MAKASCYFCGQWVKICVHICDNCIREREQEQDEIKRLQDDNNRLTALVKKHLHQRKCRGCGEIGWYKESLFSYVQCNMCGSGDTRPLNED